MNAFISHNSKVKPFVRRLSDSLRTFGIESWIDESELKFGDSLIQKISLAIESIDVVLAMISSHSVNSPWVTKELSLAMTKEINLSRIVVIPIILDKCDIPFYLRDKLYADFTGTFDYDNQVEKLVQAIKFHSGLKKSSLHRGEGSLIGDQIKMKYKPSNNVHIINIFIIICFGLFYFILYSVGSKISLDQKMFLFYVQAKTLFLLGIVVGIFGFMQTILLRSAMRVDPNLAADVGNLAIAGLLVRRFRKIVPRYWKNNIFKFSILLELVVYFMYIWMIYFLIRIVMSI